jgi:PAS domain S-box-containing protein
VATTRPRRQTSNETKSSAGPPAPEVPTPAPDGNAILRRAVDEAARLLRTDGAMSYLLDEETGVLRFAHDAGITDDRRREWVRSIKLEMGTGMFGRAVAEGRVIVTGDYMNDASFVHFPDADRLVRDIDIHSFVVAPLVSGSRTYGAMGTFASRIDAFGDAEVALVRSLADHAAAAMANADLIKQLGQSRADVERRAETERALREIGGRIIALRHPEEVLQRAVDEAARLLGADGARIDILEESSGALYWAYDATTGRRPGLGPIGGTGEAKAGEGISGRAVRELRAVFSGDYLNDERFEHASAPDEHVRKYAIRSVVAVPLIGGQGPLGTLTVYSGELEAFSPDDARLIEALAGQAAIAMTNAKLIEELDQSRVAFRHQADAERSVREIAADISALRDSDAILQKTVDEALRLLDSDSARIDMLEGDTLTWAFAAGEDALRTRETGLDLTFKVGEGVAGRVVIDGEPFRTGDYLADKRFRHVEVSDHLVEATGFRSVLSAPLRGESGPLGALSVSSHRVDAYDDAQGGLLQALADQAAIAIQNARLIAELNRSHKELERSQAAVEARAERERSLREITARITSLRDPEEILARVVEESRRLLGSDGAHLTRISDDGTYLVPVIVAGEMDEATQTWLKQMEFPLGSGINGLAAKEVRPVWTFDYWIDPRIPHEPDDVAAAERLGLRGMAAAPLRAPGGEVIGTLAISYGAPREIVPDELDLLQGLADQAAIALTNSNLYGLLGESEGRYRHLVQNAPDLVWSIDVDARFTFVSDTCERLTGWRPEDLLGKHFGALVHESSQAVAELDWTAGLTAEFQELRGRVNLLHRDGHPIPAEFSAFATLDDDGRYAGANGSVRDMSERDRLERELRESEERYRFLVENSPDIVFSTDAEGLYTYYSESVERLTGFKPGELVGRHFSSIVDLDTFPDAGDAWARFIAEPATMQVHRFSLRDRDGRRFPVEVNAIGMTDETGRFAGIHGAARDIRERVRLEADLRRQAGELASSQERAHLARELHDSVTQALFSMTLVTRTTELLVDRDPAAAKEKLGSLRDLQREALAEMRALIFELRPGNIEQDGLLAALKTHSASLQGRIGLPILVTSNLTERFPIALEEVLYRISQEALHNIVKHAAARQVTLTIDRTAKGLRLQIVDDGKGFDAGSVPDGHLGLAGMRSRAEKVGASFEVTSKLGGGTTIEVNVPTDALAAAGPAGPPADLSSAE